MATYLELVNKAIDESGCDLAQYLSTGADFTTNTEPMLRRFKTWVARSWRTVQQMVFDWEYLNNQGMVTVGPGIMFYSRGVIPGTFNPTIDIYGTDDSVLYDDVPVLGLKDLTYSQYSNNVTESFGYVNLAASNDNPLTNMAFKAGGDYFRLFDRSYVVTAGGPGIQFFWQRGMLPGASLSFLILTNGYAEWQIVNNGGFLVSYDPATSDFTQGSDGYVFTTTSEAIPAAIDSGDYEIYIYDRNISLPPDWTFPDGLPEDYTAFSFSADGTVATYEPSYSKAFLHSWKSFDFSEEINDGDYQGEICEINNSSFQFIDHGSPSPSTARPLCFVPWEDFRWQSDWLTGQPGTPGYITEDNTGRWRLYPHPNQPITLKFEYKRVPQELLLYSDVLKGIPEDFQELTMWLAIRMYGEYDEQPSVARRADRYYKDMLQRLMIKYRPKFRIGAHRLW